jgi:hypothetical protein
LGTRYHGHTIRMHARAKRHDLRPSCIVLMLGAEAVLPRTLRIEPPSQAESLSIMCLPSLFSDRVFQYFVLTADEGGTEADAGRAGSSARGSTCPWGPQCAPRWFLGYCTALYCRRLFYRGTVRPRSVLLATHHLAAWFATAPCRYLKERVHSPSPKG